MTARTKEKFDLTNLTSIGAFIALLVISAVGKSGVTITAAAVFLALAISASIHHAEVIAKRVGPSIGALILALAVTVIEVGLIVSIMANDSPSAAVVARDTVFAAVIIVTNGIAGICFLIGGLRYREVEFRVEGTSSLLAVLATLVGVTLVLPNFTTSTPGPTYSTSQLIFVSVASLVLYSSLIIAQTVTHADYFAVENSSDSELDAVPSRRKTFWSGAALFLSLTAVIGLAKTLSPTIESALVKFGAPKESVGIVIALLVLLPEAGAALAAARANQLQTSLNLALGSGAASIALTIPVISLYSIWTDRHISLGLDSKSIAFVILTFLVSSLTLGTGKSAALKGIVHLTILFAFLTLSFVP